MSWLRGNGFSLDWCKTIEEMVNLAKLGADLEINSTDRKKTKWKVKYWLKPNVCLKLGLKYPEFFHELWRKREWRKKLEDGSKNFCAL